MQAVLDHITSDTALSPQSAPLDLPSPADVLYPDFPLFTAPILPESEGTSLTDSPSTAPAFVIDSLAKADWAVSKILSAEARNSRRAELASQLHERVDQWLTKASAPDNDSILHLTTILRPFAESEIARQRRSRTLLLPSGSVSLRKLPDRLDVVDRDAALSDCEASHPEAVIVKKDLSRSVLKSLIVSGEAIAGCEFELGSDSLIVYPND
jgi:Bacteriophage Mu Gam like protein.